MSTRTDVAAFLADLRELQERHGIEIEACSCCDGVQLWHDGEQLADSVGYGLDANEERTLVLTAMVDTDDRVTSEEDER